MSENFNRKMEWLNSGSGMVKKQVSPALRSCDYKAPKMVWLVYEENGKTNDSNDIQFG